MSQTEREPESADFATGGIGAQLRQAREAAGISVEEAASDLRLSRSLLHSLEADDFQRLPPPIFTRGYLRNYAQLVGLDPEPLVAAYDRHAGAPAPAPARRERPDPDISNAGRGRELAGVFILLIAVGLAGWWWFMRPPVEREPVYDPFAELNGELLPPVEAPSAPPARAESAEATAIGRPGVDAADGEAGDPMRDEATLAADAGAPAESADANPGEVATAPPARQVPTRGAGQAGQAGRAAVEEPAATAAGELPPPGSVRIELRFAETSWTEVSGQGGQRLIYKTLPPGTERTVTARLPVRVVLGNAPAVDIRVNGKPYDVTPYLASGTVARFTLPAN